MSIDSEHPICVKQCDKQDEKVKYYETVKGLCGDHFCGAGAGGTGVCVLVFSRGGPGKESGADAAAQDTMYEGALAGLSEEEIAKLALAEEESGERQSDIGAEDSVD